MNFCRLVMNNHKKDKKIIPLTMTKKKKGIKYLGVNLTHEVKKYTLKTM
jgi:hypothetical protein